MGRGVKALCLLGVLLVAAAPVVLSGEAAAPPEGGGGSAGGAGVPEITMGEGGTVNVVDNASRCRLSLPGLYWECKTPSELLAQSQAGGCAQGSAPQGLIFIIRSKDAPAVVTLRVLPRRFLMRGKDDLESYMTAQESLLKEKGGAALEFKEQSFGEVGGMVCRRALFETKGRGQTQTYLLVHYFVRPAREDAMIYQLAAMTLGDAYEEQRADIEHIVESFRFTGELAPAFFEPDAPAEKLPRPMDESPGPVACGAQYSGLFLAVGLVVLVYLYMRRRSARKSSL